MPTSTTNYGLIKPGTDDPILVGQLNDNMDTIDTVLKDHSDKIDAAALGIKYKGEVNYYADLPNSAEIGDAYTVKYAGSSGTTPDGTEYVWGTASGTNQWINFSKDSYTKAEVDALLALKQNALTTAQLAAANSGINSAKVVQIETNKNNILLVEQMNGKKNYINVNATSQTLQTLTFTVNSDKTINVNGEQPSSVVILNINADVSLPADDYVLLDGTSNSRSELNITLYKNGSWNGTTATGGKLEFTANGIDTYHCAIYVNTTADNVVFKPMIISKSAYDAGFTDYQPYTMSNAEITAWILAHS